MKKTIKKENRLPREVWVAGISLKGLWPEKTIEKRMKDVLERMENVYAFEPDIICLPETINISWVDELKTLQEVAPSPTLRTRFTMPAARAVWLSLRTQYLRF